VRWRYCCPEWRAEQVGIRTGIERHERANTNYFGNGISLLDLANRAPELFEKRTPSEKRVLLSFVLSNCTWANGVLSPTYLQPFDMIADASSSCAKAKAAGADSGDLCQLMGG
jgi:site-specific DNA recombinase